MQKVSTLAGIIIIIIIAVIAVGGLFAYQYFVTKSQQNSEFFASRQKTNQTQTQTQTQTAGSPSQSQQATAGWKTYTNNQYGFEFKYPSNWKITSAGNGFYIFLENPEDNFRMKIYKSVLGSETVGYESVESKEILVDNYSATKSTIRGTGENVSKNYYAIITHISDKELFYEGDIDSKNLEKFTENYNRILSTFKFIP